jgi:hypothetical protein
MNPLTHGVRGAVGWAKGDSRAHHFPLANQRSEIAGFPLCYNPAYELSRNNTSTAR